MLASSVPLHTYIGMIADTQSLSVTLDNIGVKTRRSEGAVAVKYSLGSDSEEAGGAFFSREGVMCTFAMRTLDAV